MQTVDGDVRISVGFDTSQANKDAKTLESALSGVANSAKKAFDNTGTSANKAEQALEETANKANNAKKELDKVSKVKIDVSLDKSVQDYMNNLEKSTNELGASGENASGHINNLYQNLKLARQEVKNLESAGYYFGDKEYEQAVQDVAQLEAEVKKYKTEATTAGKIHFDTTQAEEAAENFAQSNSRIVQAVQERKKAQLELQALEAKGVGIGYKEYDEKIAKIAQLDAEIKTYKNTLTSVDAQETRTFSGVLTSALSSAQAAVNKVLPYVSKIGGAFASATKQVASFGLKAIKAINPAGKALSLVSSAANTLTSKLIGMAKRVFVFTVMTKALRSLKSTMQSVITTNDTMANSLAQIKGNLIVAFAPIYNVILPALNALLQGLVNVTAYLANVTSRIFGKTIAQSTQMAKSLYKQVSATDSDTKATKKNKKAKNEWLASYDELNVRQKDTNTDSGDTGGASSGITPKFNTPEMNVDWVDQIKKMIEADDWEGIGKLIATKLNNALKKIPWTEIQKTAADIASKLARLLNGFFSVMDLADTLGNTVAQALNTGLIFAYTFLTTFDFKQFGTFIGTAINSFIKNFNWGLLGDTLGAAVQGAIDTAYGFVTTYDWGSFASGIATTINHFFASIDWAEAGETVGTAIRGIFTEISTFLQEVDWEQIGKDVGTFLSNIDWTGIMTDLFGIIGDAVEGAFGLVKGTLEGLTEDGLSPIETAFLGLAAVIGGIKLGGIISSLVKMTSAFIVNTAAIWSNVAAWIADKAQTIAIYALMLKDVIQRGLQTAAIAAQTAATWLLNAAQTALNIVMSMNPIALIIIAIMALIAVFVLLWNKCDTFRQFWINLWAKIKSVASAAWKAIKGFFVSAWNNIKKVWDAAVGFFTGIWTGIKKVFSGVGKWFKNIFKGAWDGIKNIWNGVKNFFSGIWDGIKSVFSHVTDWFKDVFSKAWEAVKNVFSAGGKVFSGIKEGIVSTFKTVVNALISGINTIIKVPFNAINGMLNKIRNIKILKYHPFKKLWSENPLGVPQIPKLAEGAVIPPNKEFLAMLGDQKQGVNIESPLSTIVDAFKQVQGENGGISESSILEALKNMQINIYVEQDSKGTFNMVRSEFVQYKNRTGKDAFA